VSSSFIASFVAGWFKSIYEKGDDPLLERESTSFGKEEAL
jgi:hypothetical protein